MHFAFGLQMFCSVIRVQISRQCTLMGKIYIAALFEKQHTHSKQEHSNLWNKGFCLDLGQARDYIYYDSHKMETYTCSINCKNNHVKT
jgi:hypothetical protein